MNGSRRASLGRGNEFGSIEADVLVASAAALTVIPPAGGLLSVAVQDSRQPVEQAAQSLAGLAIRPVAAFRGLSFEEFKQVQSRASFAVLAQRLAASTKMDEPGSHQAKARPALPAPGGAY